jgi:DUF4097 and DUF4098 domain-containing protein YvlB
MKSWRYILIAIFIVLFLGICFSFAFLLIQHTSTSNGRIDRDDSRLNSTLQNTASYDISKIHQLNIDYGNMPFDITFVITDEEQLRIEEFCNKDLEKYSIQEIEEKGDKLTIKRQPKRKSIFNNALNRTYGKVTVYLPVSMTNTLESLVASTLYDMTFPDWENTPDQIVLSTVSGTIEAPTLLADQIVISNVSGDLLLENITGEITVSTISGEVRLGSANGHITLSSTSGDTMIQSMEGSLIVSKTSGDLAVKEMSGNVEVDSTSGEIELTMTNTPSDVFLEITSGDADIHYRQGSAVSFAVDTSSGSVDLPKESVYTRQERSYKEGSFGENPASTLTVESTSGDIDIELISGS